MIKLNKKPKKEIILDPTTGEILKENIVYEIDPNKRSKSIQYKSNDWYAINQEEAIKMSTTNIGKLLYTVNGRVYEYLKGTSEYGNFAPFHATHIANQLGISRQAVYKSREELTAAGLIMEAINIKTGVKGVLISNVIMQKGEVGREDIRVINKKIKEECKDTMEED